MAEDRIALLELLPNAGHEGDIDFLREGVRALAQGLLELEVSGQIGAERYERAGGRTADRKATGSGAGTRASAASRCRSRR